MVIIGWYKIILTLLEVFNSLVYRKRPIAMLMSMSINELEYQGWRETHSNLWLHTTSH
jgi:hypothetical protein